MSQRQKNITLLIVLAILMVCSVILGLVDTPTSTISNTSLFSVQDTSKVERITIVSPSESIELKKLDNVWKLNDKYKAEQNIVNVLLAILKDAEVTRQAPQSQQKQLAKYIKDNGYLVKVYGQDKLIKSFYASGNENKTTSYMMLEDEDQPFIMSIPGYGSYVAGIIEIPVDDWRDRLILSTTWRTLQQLEITYAEYPKYDVNIQFKYNFLSVDNVDKLDTARMMNFISEFNYLQADKYLTKGQDIKYDSLLNTPETVTLNVIDIDGKNSKKIRFFPLLPDDEMMLGHIENDHQMVLFQTERIQGIFAVQSDFEMKP